MSGNIRIAIDSGGTFTDCIGSKGTQCLDDDVVIKLLSVDPNNYPDAPLEGIRRILEIFQKKEIPRGSQLDLSNVSSIRMGTTIATNSALERTGEKCALVVTKGFKDVINIGDQTRPDIFDLNIRKPLPLYSMVVEIDERVTIEDFSEDPTNKVTEINNSDIVEGRSGEAIRILKEPDPDHIKTVLNVIYGTGIRSIAVAFVHSYTYPKHEQIVYDIAKAVGFSNITLSSDISPMIKYLPRTHSALADAYLTPVLHGYLNRIEDGLKNVSMHSLQFMQSDGGLVQKSKFSGLRSILSGPAGGVVGYSRTCFDTANEIPLIGFDMGGTSTDVSRFGENRLEHIFETTTAGIIIQTPQLDIHTVAAGGSSILRWENSLFKVGPQSASADPGPACYRKGGPLTITDANLVLGRLVPQYFPKIFGRSENEGLDIDKSYALFKELTKNINNDLGKALSLEEVAYGFLKVANAAMVRPIRAITETKGYMVSRHRLVSFGGAGGQHAIDIAESLNIDTVLFHRYSSILSAYGIYLADVIEESQTPCSISTKELSFCERIKSIFQKLVEKNVSSLNEQGFEQANIVHEKYLNMRYEGTESCIMIYEQDNSLNFEKWFLEQHEKEFGFTFNNRKIVVDDVRVRSIGKSNVRTDSSVDEQVKKYIKRQTDMIQPQPEFSQQCYLRNKWQQIPVFNIKSLKIGVQIKGPAILADETQTNVILENWTASILKTHIIVNKQEQERKRFTEVSDEINPIMLSIFSHRFMDIAEQMGSQLRKTSVSTNVKERLDYSCALFDPVGNLVANAPHVPVHLGSMSTCIAAQAKIWKGRLKKGDVIITNHPNSGGTHLPDITIITPSFSVSGEIIFFVASRAHHSDIGGILPGSIPPNSKHLYEEGVSIFSDLIVEQGEFMEDRIFRIFVKEPEKYPLCSGARKFSDNLSDLKAQIAANVKGVQLIQRLIDDFTLTTILKYMKAIQDNARNTIKSMLKKLTIYFNRNVFEGKDYMDDGSVIQLKVTLLCEENKYIFDFSGTSPQMYGNLNAPHSIANSAIIYCLRCLVGEDIPLNQGCLDPLTVILPVGSLLNPGEGAAVVGGNVLTSQRICDVILKTFQICADSQGDCNNLTFGQRSETDINGKQIPGYGYYETICGGAGAGPSSILKQGWNGADAVHTNMTNTRMTDVEIFERRYPVLLHKFEIRQNSGGKGKYNGGNGVIRDILFRDEVEVSILSERRALPPNGIYGGECGQRGYNLWIKKDGSEINIGGKNTIIAKRGDRIVIMTPGGGGVGYGECS